MTTRRSFLGSILALGAAPAIVRADALMRVVPVDTLVLNAADVTWSAVDFDRDTIKVVLVYRDDGRPGGDHTAVTRIVHHGPAMQLIDSDSWPVIPAAARRLLFKA